MGDNIKKLMEAKIIYLMFDLVKAFDSSDTI